RPRASAQDADTAERPQLPHGLVLRLGRRCGRSSAALTLQYHLSASGSVMMRVEKILGADVELGNILQSPMPRAAATEQAACLLLTEINGIPGQYTSPAYQYQYEGHCGASSYVAAAKQAPARFDPQDWGRKFLDTNGSCFYIDMGHLE